MGLLSITRKKIAVVSTVAVLGIGGGVAYAYWTSSGSGNGSATTTTASSALVITQTSTNSGMAPGVAASPITGTIKNNNASGGQNAHVGTVTASISGVTETAAELAANPGYTCSSADYTLTGAAMAVNQDLAPQATANFSGASIGFNNLTGTNQDACQGATVALSYVSN